MAQKKILVQLSTLFLFLLFLTLSCNKSEAADKTDQSNKERSVKVTFIELGSVNCVPCKMMQPVMDKLEENFPNDVEVLFYDVWTEEENHYAQEYGIRVIPTQVFLDENGEEYFRHEGFFPYEQVVEVLKQKGVKN
jgi:thioredoxin 1